MKARVSGFFLASLAGLAGLVVTGTASEAEAATCTDTNPCTVDAIVGGVCTHKAAASGTPCSDSNPCNDAETCNATATCVSNAPALDDGNPCTVDSCTTSGGIKHTAVKTRTSCADSNVCNGTETCNSSAKCVAGTALVVNDNNVCTADSCDPVTGVKHTAVATGTPCPDANACNGVEVCSKTATCVAGAPAVISDRSRSTSSTERACSRRSRTSVSRTSPT